MLDYQAWGVGNFKHHASFQQDSTIHQKTESFIRYNIQSMVQLEICGETIETLSKLRNAKAKISIYDSENPTSASIQSCDDDLKPEIDYLWKFLSI